MTDDLARETARRVLDAAMNHGDAEAAVQIISEALAAERERCEKAMEELKQLRLQHRRKANAAGGFYGAEDSNKAAAFDKAVRIIRAAIREEPQP